MKNVLSYLLIAFLLQLSCSAFATDYYSTKSGNAADFTTWSSSRTGNGAAPATFTDPNDNFYVQDGFTITGTSNFSCKGSLIIEKGGTYLTGNSGNTTNVATVITINDGGVLKLVPKTTLIAGFMLIQGTLQNLGGDIRLNPYGASSVAFH